MMCTRAVFFSVAIKSLFKSSLSCLFSLSKKPAWVAFPCCVVALLFLSNGRMFPFSSYLFQTQSFFYPAIAPLPRGCFSKLITYPPEFFVISLNSIQWSFVSSLKVLRMVAFYPASLVLPSRPLTLLFKAFLLAKHFDLPLRFLRFLSCHVFCPTDW